MARAAGQRGSGGFLRGLRKLLSTLLILAIVGPPVWVVLYRLVPPPITILMIERMIQGHGLDHRWVPIERISPAMTRAVVASEDARFCAHHGFDVKAIDAALRHNEARPGKIRGGSTISQQTAKNVFLWPQRSWVRKGAEAWFTVLIEAIWGKRRIMEVYLNTVEMGGPAGGDPARSAEMESRQTRLLCGQAHRPHRGPGQYGRPRRPRRLRAERRKTGRHPRPISESRRSRKA